MNESWITIKLYLKNKMNTKLIDKQVGKVVRDYLCRQSLKGKLIALNRGDLDNPTPFIECSTLKSTITRYYDKDPTFKTVDNREFNYKLRSVLHDPGVLKTYSYLHIFNCSYALCIRVDFEGMGASSQRCNYRDYVTFCSVIKSWEFPKEIIEKLIEQVGCPTQNDITISMDHKRIFNPVLDLLAKEYA